MKLLKMSLIALVAFFIHPYASTLDEFIFNYKDLAQEVLNTLDGQPTGDANLDITQHRSKQSPIITQSTVFNNFTPQNLTTRLQQFRTTLVPSNIPKAEISYLFADVKFDGTTLKILELGEGKNGGYRSFDAVFEEGRIWQGFWNYVCSLGLPVFYVGPTPTNAPINKIGTSLNNKLSWNVFKQKKCLAVNSIEALKTSGDFQALLQKNTDFSGEKLKHYKGVIVYKYRDDREPFSLKEIDNFKKEYPDFLVLDRVSRPFAASKYLNDILFRSGSDTNQYRPACKLYPKKFHADLAQQIVDDLGGDIFVIKPLDSGMSNGIIITSKELLSTELRRILIQPGHKSNLHPSTFNHRPADTLSHAYWLGDTNQHFLVESYAQSRIITVLGKQYDPTIRVVFGLVHDDGKIHVKFFENWWKLPPQGLTDKSTLTLKHVSQYRPDLKQLPATQLTLTPEDENVLRTLMADAMAHAYVKMLALEQKTL